MTAIELLGRLEQPLALERAARHGLVDDREGRVPLHPGALVEPIALGRYRVKAPLGLGEPRRRRLLALLAQGHVGPDVLRLVEHGARAAQRALRLGEPRGVQLVADAPGQGLLIRQARLQLLLVLPHHPLRVTQALGAGVGALVGPHEHHEGRGGHQQREGDEHEPQRQVREAAATAAEDEEGHAPPPA